MVPKIKITVAPTKNKNINPIINNNTNNIAIIEPFRYSNIFIIDINYCDFIKLSMLKSLYRKVFKEIASFYFRRPCSSVNYLVLASKSEG